jgi:hypothetical protein
MQLIGILRGGLGNNLNLLVKSIWLTKSHGCNQLTLYWSNRLAVNNELHLLQLFDLQFLMDQTGISIQLGLHADYLRFFQGVQPFIGKNFFVLNNGDITPVDQPTYTSQQVRGYHPRLIYESIHPNENLQARIGSFVNKYQLEQRLGVHVRSTDHEFCKKNSPLEKYFKRLDACQDPLLVCSDHQDIDQAMLQRYGQRVLLSHKTNDKRWGRPRTREKRIGRQGIEEAVIDLFLLANCKQLLVPFVSTFSKNAVRIGKLPFQYAV